MTLAPTDFSNRILSAWGATGWTAYLECVDREDRSLVRLFAARVIGFAHVIGIHDDGYQASEVEPVLLPEPGDHPINLSEYRRLHDCEWISCRLVHADQPAVVNA
jgi:hypothetical protein